MRSPAHFPACLGIIAAFLGPIPAAVMGFSHIGSGPASLSESLPAPQFHGWSFELLSNSYYPVPSGFCGTLSDQVLANVLWAMAQVPQFGEYRELFVALPDNLYRYDQLTHTILRHKRGDLRYNSGSAFEIGVAVPSHEECGMVVQAGLLAATAFWTREKGNVVSCPLRWAVSHANTSWDPDHPLRMVVLFGNAEASGLDTLLVARSSDQSLPDPHTSGADTFERVVANLVQDSLFEPIELSWETISQLLWAGYGVTPHLTFRSRQALTVPGALGNYRLTGRLFLVHRQGVDRYHSRLPGDNELKSRDHRLERIVTGDRRAELSQASARIPDNAAAYFVVCVSDTGDWEALQEAGAVAFQLMAQARALGLSGFLTMPLTRSERRMIAASLDLPDGNLPVLVFACGAPADQETSAEPGDVQIVTGPPAVRTGILRVEYLLRRAGTVRAEVFDLLGRPVRLLFEEHQAAGYHSAYWNGTDGDGRPVKRGSYILVVSSSGSVAQHKVTWAR
ncbi:MAG: FlgD immunoglobulin-like domain containing protein [candidate division WOR-3 bacterium]